jgi:hypothetical protein
MLVHTSNILRFNSSLLRPRLRAPPSWCIGDLLAPSYLAYVRYPLRQCSSRPFPNLAPLCQQICLPPALSERDLPACCLCAVCAAASTPSPAPPLLRLYSQLPESPRSLPPRSSHHLSLRPRLSQVYPSHTDGHRSDPQLKASTLLHWHHLSC